MELTRSEANEELTYVMQGMQRTMPLSGTILQVGIGARKVLLQRATRAFSKTTTG